MANTDQKLDSLYLSQVPDIGVCITIPVPDICDALGIDTGSAGDALTAFSTWADSRGLAAFQLNENLEILARRYSAT